MRAITIILACLLSMNAMAQKKDNGYIESKSSGPHKITKDQLAEMAKKPNFAMTDTAISFLGEIATNGTAFHYPFQGMTLQKLEPQTLTIMGGFDKPAMTVTMPDSLGIVRGYINRKKVVWTSDSTFTIKTRD